MWSAQFVSLPPWLNLQVIDFYKDALLLQQRKKRANFLSLQLQILLKWIKVQEIILMSQTNPDPSGPRYSAGKFSAFFSHRRDMVGCYADIVSVSPLE